MRQDTWFIWDNGKDYSCHTLYLINAGRLTKEQCLEVCALLRTCSGYGAMDSELLLFIAPQEQGKGKRAVEFQKWNVKQFEEWLSPDELGWYDLEESPESMAKITQWVEYVRSGHESIPNPGHKENLDSGRYQGGLPY